MYLCEDDFISRGLDYRDHRVYYVPLSDSQIDKTTNKMEVASAEFIDILQEPTR
ncbi:MAG: hypothetical protein WDM78_07380 [Puia sp.]